MRCRELSDSEWSLIPDLMPLVRGTGRPGTDHRQSSNAVMWILRTGAPWRDLPDYYGRYQTVFDRLAAFAAAHHGSVSLLPNSSALRYDQAPCRLGMLPRYPPT
jgi:transposase